MAIALKNFLSRARSVADTRRRARARLPMPPPAPEAPVYFVGDVHGRADLLRQMLDAIDADMAGAAPDRAQLVFAGDYIDRGDASHEVLDTLVGLTAAHPGRVHCLIGNHERMMLDFLDRPERSGGRWLANGGLQTLASYGVGGVAERSSGTQLAQAAEVLRAKMPAGLEAWLRALPDRWISGNLVCVHAAMDPSLPPDRQEAKTLIWGHPRFLAEPRQDGYWVAHGHTVVDVARAEGSRIAVDTGACFTGRLSAAAICAGEAVRFLNT